MFRFVRPAPWLRALFTASQTRQPNPTSLSDEVSLQQPYDGGGFPLLDPGEWHIGATTAAAASAATTLVTLEDDEIGRILAFSAMLSAGVAPTVIPDIVGQGGNTVAIAPQTVLPASNLQSFEIRSPIIGPGHALRGFHFGGDAATVVIYRVYLVRVPIGTVFYI